MIAIPLLIKDILYSFSIDPFMEHTEINSRLKLLGWGDIELDYHTCELARASFEMRN